MATLLERSISVSLPHPHSLNSPSTSAAILGNSEAMHRIRAQVRHLGPHFRTVLLHGESGTGKQRVAQALHRASSHANGPFIVAHCPTELHTSTSLNNAADTLGTLLETAHRGTLYLREISTLAFDAQAHLLHLLRSRERARGPILVHGLEARIIVSTTQSLRPLAATGRFHEQLYRRLSAVEIELPPLREHPEDIELIATTYLQRQVHQRRLPSLQLSQAALDHMQAYSWPRNITQLHQYLDYALEHCDSNRIEAHHLPKDPPPTQTPEAAPAEAPLRLQDVVEQHVFHVLEHCAGNKVRAAEMLGISRSTLYRMLESGAPSDMPCRSS